MAGVRLIFTRTLPTVILPFAGPAIFSNTGSGVGRILHSTCPAGSPEIRITIKKRLKHERYQLSYFFLVAVGLRIEGSILAQPLRQARRKRNIHLHRCPIRQLRKLHPYLPFAIV